RRQPPYSTAYFNHTRFPGRQHIIYHKGHAPIAYRVTILLRRHNVMSTDIDAILLRIIAKAHGHNMGFALLADGRQPAKALTLEIRNFFWSKFAHHSLSLVYNDVRPAGRLLLSYHYI